MEVEKNSKNVTVKTKWSRTGRHLSQKKDRLAYKDKDCQSLDIVYRKQLENNNTFEIMRDDIYKEALECKEFEEKEIKTIKTVISYRGMVLSDYTIKGDIKKYEKKLLCLRGAIKSKYPSIYAQMQEHIDEYDNDRIVHLSALKTLTNCIISLEEQDLGKKKIFISHSSKDKKIIAEFIDHILQLGIGIDTQDIFCTSIEDLGIKNGNDIREHIRKNIQTSDYSFLMISNNYKKSEICLNEMGAVWAYNNNIRYYLLPETKIDSIGWLCDPQRADVIDSPITLDAIRQELKEYYQLPDTGTEWSRHRQTFLDFIANNK